jgi:tetratricopeptide (TPR) repeat protein
MLKFYHLLFIFILFRFQAIGQSDDLNYNYSKYDSLYNIGQYEEAIIYAEKCLDFKIKKFQKSHINYGFFLNNLAKCYVAIGQNEKALSFYLKALETTEKNYGKNDALYGAYSNNIAGLYHHLKQYELALQYYLQALEITKNNFGEDHTNYAVVLRNIAFLYQSMGRYRDALPIIKQVLAILEINNEQEIPNYGQDLETTAELFIAVGEYKNALPYYLDAINHVISTEGKENAHYTSLLNSISDLYMSLKDYKKAYEISAETLEYTERIFGEDHFKYAIALNRLAYLGVIFGHYNESWKIHLRALKIVPKNIGNKSFDQGIILSRIARSMKKMVDLQDALPWYIDAMEETKNYYRKEHSEYLNRLEELGTTYHELGQYENTLKIYLEVVGIKEKVFGKNDSRYAMSLNNLAKLFEDLGEYKKSLTYLLNAKEIIEQDTGATQLDYGIILNNVAAIYIRTNETQKALSLLNESLEIHEHILGKEDAKNAHILNNIAVLYQGMGEYQKALPIRLEALKLIENNWGKEHPSYAKYLYNLAFLYETIDKIDKALPLYLESLKITERTLGKRHSDYGLFLTKIALLYNNSGDYQAAIPLLLNANKNTLIRIEDIFNFRSEAEKKLFLRKVMYYFDFQQSFDINSGNQSGQITELNLNNQYLQKGLLANSSRSVFKSVTNSGNAETKKTYLNFQEVKHTLSRQYSLPINDRFLNTDSLENLSNTLESELVKHSSELADFKTMTKTTWQDVQSQLKSGQAAIEFSHFRYYNKEWTDSTLYVAYLIKPESKNPEVIYLFEEKALDPLIEGKTSYDNKKKPIKLYFFKSALKELYQLIWQPLEPYLEGVEDVFISPSGKLHQIAFAALPDSAGELLVNKYNLNTMNSTGSLVLNDDPPEFTPASFAGGITYNFKPQTGEKADTAIISVYNPKELLSKDTLRNNSGSTWGLLPGTRTEVNALSALYKQQGYDNTVFSGNIPTETWLKGMDENSPKVLHLATHGFFFENAKGNKNTYSLRDKPIYTLANDPLMRSGLIMAHANYAWANGSNPYEEEDGILTAYEISHMNLQNTDLVVLSACETGLGDISGSEGVYGLQRAFRMAGVDYIIMSLWAVPDIETGEFMQQFYTYWLNGISIRKAFTKTQREMSTIYHNSPKKWAGFVLVE